MSAASSFCPKKANAVLSRYAPVDFEAGRAPVPIQHGFGKRPWYNYRYRDEELQLWVGRVEEVSRATRKVFGYFNNHFHGFAIESSLKMLSMLGAASTDQQELLNIVNAKLEARPTPR